MTSHELAKKLLEQPDAPVEIRITSPHDGFTADTGDCVVELSDIDVGLARSRGYQHTQPGKCVVVRGWMSSEENEDED